jgi:hypothetical protein
MVSLVVVVVGGVDAIHRIARPQFLVLRNYLALHSITLLINDQYGWPYYQIGVIKYNFYISNAILVGITVVVHC